MNESTIRSPRKSNKPLRISRHIPTLAERDDGWFCHYCQQPLVQSAPNGEYPTANVGPFAVCIVAWAVVDHVVPRARGGSDDLNNLVLICALCNSRKGPLEYAVFMRRIRAWILEHHDELQDIWYGPPRPRWIPR